MANPVFNRTLTLQMQSCRYLVYGTLLGLQIFYCYVTANFLSAWLVLLLVLPALVHLGLQLSMNTALYLHVFEVVALPGTLLLAGAPAELLIIALVTVIVCNALLWGGYALPVLVGLAVASGLALSGLSKLPTLTDVPHLLGVSCASIGLLLLAVATISQQRATKLAIKDVRMKKQNVLLRRYLPDDMWREANETRRTQRTWTTVVFIDLCGFTAAIERLSPELIEELLNDFLAAVTEPIQNQQGIVHKFLGDGVLCVFNAPEAQQRHAYARQGLVAAKAVGVAIRRLNRDWQMRGLPHNFDVSIGLASGYCTLGDWGTSTRLDYTVIGGVVNLASRLQDKAPAGQIYLDETTAHMLGETECAYVRSSALRGLGSTKIYAPLPG